MVGGAKSVQPRSGGGARRVRAKSSSFLLIQAKEEAPPETLSLMSTQLATCLTKNQTGPQAKTDIPILPPGQHGKRKNHLHLG